MYEWTEDIRYLRALFRTPKWLFERYARCFQFYSTKYSLNFFNKRLCRTTDIEPIRPVISFIRTRLKKPGRITD